MYVVLIGHSKNTAAKEIRIGGLVFTAVGWYCSKKLSRIQERIRHFLLKWEHPCLQKKKDKNICKQYTLKLQDWEGSHWLEVNRKQFLLGQFLCCRISLAFAGATLGSNIVDKILVVFSIAQVVCLTPSLQCMEDVHLWQCSLWRKIHYLDCWYYMFTFKNQTKSSLHSSL